MFCSIPNFYWNVTFSMIIEIKQCFWSFTGTIFMTKEEKGNMFHGIVIKLQSIETLIDVRYSNVIFQKRINFSFYNYRVTDHCCRNIRHCQNRRIWRTRCVCNTTLLTHWSAPLHQKRIISQFDVYLSLWLIYCKHKSVIKMFSSQFLAISTPDYF